MNKKNWSNTQSHMKLRSTNKKNNNYCELANNLKPVWEQS